jgi:hypothetical protein
MQKSAFSVNTSPTFGYDPIKVRFAKQKDFFL